MSILRFACFIVWFLASIVLAQDNAGPAQPELVDSSNYIVVFKPNVNSLKISNQIQRMQLHQVASNKTIASSSASASSVNTTLHSTKNSSYSSIGKFRWYSARFHTEAIEHMLATNTSSTTTANNITFNTDENDAVHYYVKDATFSLQEFIQTNPPSWGLDRIDQRQGTDGRYSFATDQGQGVTIYLMDSGIRQDHTDIAGRVKIGKTVVGDVNDPSDANGHGTFVAGVCCGTKYGVAKKAEIVSVKTLDSEGNGHLSDVLVGLEWIVQQHKATPNAKSIVNLSLGALYSQATNDAIQEAISLGIHFVIAAGNYGEDACKYSPGSTPGAITVGAIDEDDSVSYYSNFGKCVDIFAPGTNIKSIWSTSSSATHTLTGTSMAAPHVAGTMAIFLSQANYTPPELQSYIKRVSSLMSQDFTINNTGSFYNENKTVLDNSINTGYKVKDRLGQKTLVNILFSHPNDSTPFWIYGQSLNQASTTQNSCIQPVFMVILFIATYLAL
ncbi:peptidase S8/S53 domain-containing protein [Mucor lusitanicus]|uniref:Peptidase S8/S53 domain-containing protein n=2 Tax=Mucor circinelloides f. lusitanicus TaxID=29924 RepID=A0A8H4BMY3_MUCCL|nr:peptidase S8/S53 domain-containing protein [Mucor lusitanicus]